MTPDSDIFGAVYEKDALVYAEGDPGTDMYVIQSGAVRITQERGGQTEELTLLGPGEVFGEMALLIDAPRSATVTAAARTRLLRFSRDSLLSRVPKDPDLLIHLMRALSRRLETASKEAEKSRLVAVPADPDSSADDLQRFTGNLAPPPSLFEGGTGPVPPDIENLVHQFIACFPGGETVEIPEGKLVFREGQEGTALYILVDGRIDIWRDSPLGRSAVARMGPCEFFGEMAILTGRPRSASASAAVPSRMFRIPHKAFIEGIRSHPDAALYVVQVLILRLKDVRDVASSAVLSPEMSRRTHLPSTTPGPRLRIGMLSLSSCGGCATVLLEDPELLADAIGRHEFRFCPMLMDEQEIREVDLLLVDGVVRVAEDVEKLHEARHKARELVAWGTCATFGGVPGLANDSPLEELIDETYGDTQDSLSFYLSGESGSQGPMYEGSEMELLRKMFKVDDVVRVDHYVPGCPPRPALLRTLAGDNRAAMERRKIPPIVCGECPRKARKQPLESLRSFPAPDESPGTCLLSSGCFCLGLLTRGGCGAPCTAGGLPCWGCRGPSDMMLRKMAAGSQPGDVVRDTLCRRTGLSHEAASKFLSRVNREGNGTFHFERTLYHALGRIR